MKAEIELVPVDVEPVDRLTDADLDEMYRLMENGADEKEYNYDDSGIDRVFG